MSQVLLIDIPTFWQRVPPAYQAIREQLSDMELRLQRMLLGEQQGIHQHQGGFLTYSRGILQLAAILLEKGHQVDYLSTLEMDFWRRLERVAPRYILVGVTCMTASYHILRQACRTVRQHNPSALIVAGGFHVSYLAETVLRESPAIDVVVVGDGDRALLQLADAPNDLDAVPDIVYRTTDAIRRNPSSPVLSMNRVPPLAYHLLPQRLASYSHNLITARGCKYDCEYCLDSRLPLRFASVERTLQELLYLQAHLPAGTLVFFADNVFSANRRRAIELARAIARYVPNLRFGCELRAEDIDDELIRELVAAGFVALSTGLDDANEDVLDRTRRSIPVETSIRALETLRRHSRGMINIAWVTGLPGSTCQSLENNMDTIRQLLRERLVDQVSNRILVPYPGTVLFDQAEAHGIRLKHQRWAQYDRFLPPVFDLDTLTGETIYDYFIRTECIVLEAYRQQMD